MIISIYLVPIDIDEVWKPQGTNKYCVKESKTDIQYKETNILLSSNDIICGEKTHML